MDKQSLYTLMEDHGIRPTANRVLIASALLKGDGPKTMKELETALLSIDKSVISRTMALFRSHHLVHVIEGGTGVASYELCLSHATTTTRTSTSTSSASNVSAPSA